MQSLRENMIPNVWIYEQDEKGRSFEHPEGCLTLWVSYSLDFTWLFINILLLIESNGCLENYYLDENNEDFGYKMVWI